MGKSVRKKIGDEGRGSCLGSDAIPGKRKRGSCASVLPVQRQVPRLSRILHNDEHYDDAYVRVYYLLEFFLLSS